MPRLEAVIWDMDGVIADTASYHFKAWQTVFSRRKARFTEQDFRRNFGRRNDTIIRNTVRGITAEDLEAIAAEKDAEFRRRVAENVKALPGAIEMIRSLREQGIKNGIASSAPMENIDLIIRALGIRDYFQAIVWGGEVTEGKPSPQGYLLAARKLGVRLENCLVVEDAIDGVAGAKRAGMKCLAVTYNHSRESLREADLVVDTLESVSVGALAGLFQPEKEVRKGA